MNRRVRIFQRICFAVIEKIDSVAGAASNIGGGSDNALSLLEFKEA